MELYNTVVVVRRGVLEPVLSGTNFWSVKVGGIQYCFLFRVSPAPRQPEPRQWCCFHVYPLARILSTRPLPLRSISVCGDVVLALLLRKGKPRDVCLPELLFACCLW